MTTNAVVPYAPAFAPLVHATQHQLAFAAKRRKIIDEIKYIGALRQAAGSLEPTTLYKLVLQPEGAKLHTDAAGNIRGVFYKNGKIVKHASFKSVRPAFMKAIRGVGTQVLLISIAVQLDHIREAVGQVAIDLHNDRLAEIEAGRNQLSQAFLVEDGSRREQFVLHAIQSLNCGIAKTLRALRRQIAALPTADSGFLDNWGLSSKAAQAKQKMALASESYHAVLFGIQLLSEAYAFLGEPRAAVRTLTDLIAAVNDCGVAEAAERARLVPRDDDLLPETQWKLFQAAEPTLRRYMEECERLASDGMPGLTIELEPGELLKGSDNAQVQAMQ